MIRTSSITVSNMVALGLPLQPERKAGVSSMFVFYFFVFVRHAFER